MVCVLDTRCGSFLCLQHHHGLCAGHQVWVISVSTTPSWSVCWTPGVGHFCVYNTIMVCVLDTRCGSFLCLQHHHGLCAGHQVWVISVSTTPSWSVYYTPGVGYFCVYNIMVCVLDTRCGSFLCLQHHGLCARHQVWVISVSTTKPWSVYWTLLDITYRWRSDRV